MSGRDSFRWDVMVVREFEGKDGTQKVWTKVGVAFPGKGDSVSVQLDALPLDGRLVLVVPKTEEEWEAYRNGGGNNGRQAQGRGGSPRGRGGQQRGGGQRGSGGSQRRGGAPRPMNESIPDYPGPRRGGGGGGFADDNAGGGGFADDAPKDDKPDDFGGDYGGGADDEIPF